MRRFFGTRRLFLSGKNKISILNPCSSCPFTFCSSLYRIALLGTLCLLTTVLLQRDAESTNLKARLDSTPTARIFCIISSYAYRQVSTAVHVKRTWAEHCDHFLFVSDDSHEELEPAVFQNLPDKWQQIRAHLEYVYKYHFDQGDWFLYANDDNFIVVENLRFMLKSYNSQQLIYFGCKLRSATNQTYMYDRAGFVLSSATLRKFVLEALPNATLCSEQPKGDAAAEELGRCLSNLHVQAGDSRDHLGLHRFLPFQLKDHMGQPLNASLEQHKNFLDRSYYEVADLTVLASARAISSHIEYMPIIYNLYYLAYTVRIFGVSLEDEWTELENDQ
ncbi:hypothetical protein KR222_010788 [Zaprionus bogoriensis]|nr:hypothetical protein KR222_010788 [Zaprionus bogoriensis]